MHVLRFVCLLVFLCFYRELGHLAHAQTPAPFAFKSPKRHKARVPLLLQRNLLVISARLNGFGPFNFLLDTGVSTSIITSAKLADSLHLRHGDKFRVIGAGGSDTGLQAYQTDSVCVTIRSVEAPHLTMLVLSEDVLNLSGYVGVPIHGILGSELFRSFVVAPHPEQETMELIAPTHYRAPRGKYWSSLPLTIENNKAYFVAPVQLSDSLTMRLKLVLDTGASHALSLETDSDPNLVAPAKRLHADLGRGLTGVVRGYLARVPILHLGRYQMRSVLTSFPDAADVHRRIDVPRNGNVGYELLKRFSLVIDYPHHRMLLRPNTRFSDPFEHDMCGLDLMALAPDYRRYLVLRVEPHSPAEEAGLLPDDELLSINFIPIGVFSLTQLSHMMHSENGRVLLLVLRRPDGSLLTTTVRLKRQI
jgi:hypothetical protein